MADTELPPGTAWAYGHHVFLGLWDSSPVPGGRSYREIADAEAAQARTDVAP